MSGPNPPELGSGEAESGNGLSVSDEARGGETGETGPYRHSRAYSAPEFEQFTSGPYVPIDPHLYDYDSYEVRDESDTEGGQGAQARPPRWPWVVGVTVIIAAVALVVSVALLFVRTETDDLATPATPITSTPSLPPVQDEIITTTPPPAPPPPSEEPPPPPPEPETTAPPPVEAPPETTTQPPETTTTTTTSTTTTTTPAGPRQITYSVTGTKAPFDQITITYIGPSGQRQTLRNAYIPWSLTLTPISRSEVGSVEASSLLRLSRLNCSITTNDGTVLFSNANDGPQASCG